MGISRLNFFLRTACGRAIHKHIHLRDLRGKTISIDTSIYLYKFKAAGGLIDNFYKMCSLFKYYDITPIFVFDGKPPPEKKTTLILRKEKKIKAENEYNNFKRQLENNTNHESKTEDYY